MRQKAEQVKTFWEARHRSILAGLRNHEEASVADASEQKGEQQVNADEGSSRSDATGQREGHRKELNMSCVGG